MNVKRPLPVGMGSLDIEDKMKGPQGFIAAIIGIVFAAASLVIIGGVVYVSSF